MRTFALVLILAALFISNTAAQGQNNAGGNGGQNNAGEGSNASNGDSSAGDSSVNTTSISTTSINTTSINGTEGTSPGTWDGGVSVQILGQSGKMRLSNSAGTEVKVEMNSIFEVSEAGTNVGLAGPNAGKHGRNTFANVAFTYDTEATRTSVDGVAADRINFQTTLLQTATLQISTWVFLGAGSINPTDSERWNVTSGSIKFSISIDDWPYCTGTSGNPCGGESGEYIDVSVAIIGPAGADEQASGSQDTGQVGNTSMSLGGDVSIELSNRVRVDSNWTSMPDGYPISYTETVEGQVRQVFIFRFPKGISLFYDPIIQGLGSSDETYVVTDDTPFVVITSFTASGVVEDYDTATKSNILNVLAQAMLIADAGAAPEGSTLTVTAASVNLEASFPVASQTAATAAIASLNFAVSSASDLTSLLAAAGVTGVTVESMPTTSASAAVQGTTSSDTMIIIAIGAAVVATGGMIVIACVVRKVKGKRGKKAVV